MWICLVLVLGLVAFIAARRNVRAHSAGELARSQPMASTCVAPRSQTAPGSTVPTGPSRPAGRRQRTRYAAPRR